MIVIEGPDGSGKTTLAKRLYKDLNERGRNVLMDERSRDVPKDAFQNAMDALANMMRWHHDPEQYRPIIYDRLMASELIYGQALRGKWVNGMNPRSVSAMFSMMAFHAIPMILCQPPFSAVENNVKQSDQLDGVVNHIKQIYDMYDALFHSLYREKVGKVPYIFNYDYTNLEPTGWKGVGSELGFMLRPRDVKDHYWANTTYEDLLDTLDTYIAQTDENPQGIIPPPVNPVMEILQQLKEEVPGVEVHAVEVKPEEPKEDKEDKVTLL